MSRPMRFRIRRSGRKAVEAFILVTNLVALSCASDGVAPQRGPDSGASFNGADPPPRAVFDSSVGDQLKWSDSPSRPSNFERDARDVMFQFYRFTRSASSPYPFVPQLDIFAVQRAGALGHKGFVAPLVDAASITVEPMAARAIGQALRALTGEIFGGDIESVPKWYRWLDRHREIEPKIGYARWKGAQFSQFDLSLEGFL